MKAKALLVMPSSPLTGIDLDGADLERLFLPTIIFFLSLSQYFERISHYFFSTINMMYSTCMQYYIVHSVFHV